ncbi:MAG: phytanoyl-CoA dioxygenase family protein [Bacteroidota bacterium]
MSTTISEFFAAAGYYHAKGVFGPAEVQILRQDFDRIVQQISASKEELNARWDNQAVMEKLGAAESVILHTNNVQQYSAKWMRAFYQENFLAIAGEILGEDIVLHHSKLFQKPAGSGVPFPMHQDWSYFPTRDDSMIAAIIHLSPATDEMGCLRVYPGSHTLGRLAGSNGQGGGQTLADYPLERAVALEAEAGDVVFFHYCTLHGSLPNRSDQVRKTVLVQLHAGTDEVEAGIDHPNERLVLSGWNYASRRGNTAGK